MTRSAHRHTAPTAPTAVSPARARRRHRRSRNRASGLSRDVPSFTVEALPVETFEGLLVVASWLGEVLDDDPPYRLDVHLHDPVECWCRLDVVPDAGSSTVSLTVAWMAAAGAGHRRSATSGSPTSTPSTGPEQPVLSGVRSRGCRDLRVPYAELAGGGSSITGVAREAVKTEVGLLARHRIFIEARWRVNSDRQVGLVDNLGSGDVQRPARSPAARRPPR